MRSVVVRTPIFEPGTGAYTMFAQVAAEVLGVDVASVDVQVWDTDAVPFDSGVAGSRTTRMAIPAVHEAAEAALDGLLQAASAQTGWPVDALTSDDGQIWHGGTESISWASVVEAAGGTISGRGHSQVTGQPEHTAFAAQVAEVEVDEETGQVRILRFTSAHDVGTVINPIAHQGQINGAVVMGFGYALQEELLTDAGRVTTLSLADFKLPNVADLPALETVLVHVHRRSCPVQRKGHRGSAAARRRARHRQCHPRRHGRPHEEPAGHRRAHVDGAQGAGRGCLTPLLGERERASARGEGLCGRENGAHPCLVSTVMSAEMSLSLSPRAMPSSNSARVRCTSGSGTPRSAAASSTSPRSFASSRTGASEP